MSNYVALILSLARTRVIVARVYGSMLRQKKKSILPSSDILARAIIIQNLPSAPIYIYTLYIIERNVFSFFKLKGECICNIIARAVYLDQECIFPNINATLINMGIFRQISEGS